MNPSSESLIKCSFFEYRWPAGNQERKSPNEEKTDLTFKGCFWRKNITWGRDSGKGKVYSELPLPASQPHVFCCA